MAVEVGFFCNVQSSCQSTSNSNPLFTSTSGTQMATYDKQKIFGNLQQHFVAQSDTLTM